MRIRVQLQAALLVGIFPLCPSLFAQFTAPTPEELKMTSEPKAPGAAAVYLYREETVDDNLHYHSFYTRIKVLTEKGKELATVSVDYVKGKSTLTDVKARTIHADGTILPLEVKPTDLVEHKEGDFQVNKVVFTLPSAEVGSILEYRWQLRYDDNSLSSPDWQIQQPYYVRKAHYMFVSYKYMDRVTNSRGQSADKLLYSSFLPENTKVLQDVTGKYTLDIADVAPMPDEEYMPPLEAWMVHVTFYYSPYVSQDDFWKNEGQRWSKEVDRFAGESKTLKDAVAGLVAPGDTDDAKARKLYDAVMTLDNTDYSRRKSKAELKELHLKRAADAEDVWKQKSGTSDEIAMLYLAMVRIAGLKAYAMEVCNRDRQIFNPYYLSMSQFDDVLVKVSIGGKDTPLDPGSRFATFGQLDWRHSLTGAIMQSDKGPVFGETSVNPYKLSVTSRVADLTIGKDGSVQGTVRIAMSGPAALRWRRLALEDDEDEVKKRFNEEMKGQVPDGVTAEFDHFLGLEDYHLQLMGVVKITGNIATATGKRLFVPALFFESRAKHPFVSSEFRQTAVDMKYAETVQDDVTYRLPDSFAVESAPADASIPWSGRAVLQIKSHPDKSQIMISRTLVRGFALVPPKEYGDLRGFYQKVATADQQQLVLRAAPVSSGN